MDHSTEMISIPVAHLLGSVSAEMLAKELLKRAQSGRVEPAPCPQASNLPAIGAAYQDGIYAGLTLAGNKPAALVLLPGDEKLIWQDAVAWAENQGGTLPSRIDQLVLWKNLKSEFQDRWYWSNEQFAYGGAYAWVQNFYNGTQDFSHKDNLNRARAVRRLPIE